MYDAASLPSTVTHLRSLTCISSIEHYDYRDSSACGSKTAAVPWPASPSKLAPCFSAQLVPRRDRHFPPPGSQFFVGKPASAPPSGGDRAFTSGPSPPCQAETSAQDTRIIRITDMIQLFACGSTGLNEIFNRQTAAKTGCGSRRRKETGGTLWTVFGVFLTRLECDRQKVPNVAESPLVYARPLCV